MRTSQFHPTLFTLTLLVLASTSYAADPKVEPLGDDTYRVTVNAKHKFTRNTEKLQAEATQIATEFCARRGKHLKVVSVDDRKSMYLVGDMAKVTLTFQALDTAEPAPATATVSSTARTPTTNEALYNDLLRLDDLRKKGILTDDEFAAEKKKLLDRTK